MFHQSKVGDYGLCIFINVMWGGDLAIRGGDMGTENTRIKTYLNEKRLFPQKLNSPLYINTQPGKPYLALTIGWHSK